MSVSIGSMSPYSIIAFVQEHAAELQGAIKTEMERAQDRNNLIKDIANLAATLETCKATGDYAGANKAVYDFMKDHKETWGGAEHDLVPLLCNTQAWAQGCTINAGTYQQVNYSGADNPGNSFHSDWQQTSNLDADGVRDNVSALMDGAIKQLNSWKDEISGDDKLEMMTLTEDAKRLNDLYEVGSNLNASHHQACTTIINNMKG